jgi:hypothetical protein
MLCGGEIYKGKHFVASVVEIPLSFYAYIGMEIDPVNLWQTIQPSFTDLISLHISALCSFPDLLWSFYMK